MIKGIKKFFDVMAYRRRINTLEGQVEVLQGVIKDEAYKKIMTKLDEEETTKRLKKENAEFRIKLKESKQKIMNLEMRDRRNDKKRNIS